MSSSRRRCLAALALLAATDAGRGSASEAVPAPNTEHEHGQERIIRHDDAAINTKPMPMPAANSGTCTPLW